MKKSRIVPGAIVGRLTALRPAPNNKHNQRSYWWRCVCGVEKIIVLHSVITGYTQSCGCLNIEKHTKHGRHATKEYRAWQNIIQRCYRAKVKAYPHYGGRGIKVCRRWRDSFDAFLADMGNAPSQKHSIDRIDNNGDYEPSNCRWATIHQQANNRTVNRFVTIDGKTQTLAEWARDPRCHVKPWSIRQRLNRGFDGASAVFNPPMSRFKPMNAALSSGKDVPGAHLESSGRSLRVR